MSAFVRVCGCGRDACPCELLCVPVCLYVMQFLFFSFSNVYFYMYVFLCVLVYVWVYIIFLSV